MRDPVTPPPAPSVPAGWYPHEGGQRYWDGTTWTEHRAPAAQPAVVVMQQRPSNGLAVGSLITGIAGFVLMAIPFFIGLFIGGTLDIVAVILGICGIIRANRTRVGMPLAVVGLVLGGVSLLSVFVGAGTLW